MIASPYILIYKSSSEVQYKPNIAIPRSTSRFIDLDLAKILCFPLIDLFQFLT